jgi:hypothetical protein
VIDGLTGAISDEDDEYPLDEEPDPERLMVCGYWRCGELFERRTANQQFCRKACRSRQRKWERAQDRRAARDERKA